jgi:hypothetical protein
MTRDTLTALDIVCEFSYDTTRIKSNRLAFRLERCSVPLSYDHLSPFGSGSTPRDAFGLFGTVRGSMWGPPSIYREISKCGLYSRETRT